MRSLFALYRQQFKTTLAMMLQYRASLFIWMTAHVLEPLVYLLVWSAVAAANGGNVGGYDAPTFAAYFLLLMLVNHMTYTWIMYEYEYRVREGLLSQTLLKPVHPIHSDIADNISSKLITLPAMLVVAGVLGLLFHAAASPPVWALLLFLPVIVLACLVRFLLEWTLAQAAFWTTRVSALNQAYFMLVLFLSGQLAPISILPAPVRLAANLLPFRWLIGFPVELLLGRLSFVEAISGLGLQLIWLAITVFLVRLVWRAGVKVYSAVGA